uniref:Reverse transcriptase domain-containing protein n=1 Tax=Cannabis sativa TaxID=3483 RepID=A0A803PR33_CANSA
MGAEAWNYEDLNTFTIIAPLQSSQGRFLVSVTEHAHGLFLVTFGCEGDKGRILEGQPWHFAQSITIFAAPESSFPITPDTLHYVPFWIQVYGIPFMCKSFDLARFIAAEVGDLIEVDKDTVKEGTGPYLRLRILLDVNLPIRRGMNIRFIRMGREFVKWIDFKYERLPDFCFFCGKLDHTKRYCHFYLQKYDESQTDPPCPYTILLRGKEKIVDKSMPFQYPHPPAITVVDHAPVNLNLPTKNFLDNIISFPSFLAATGNFGSNFLSPYTSSTVMIPTPVNPNSAHAFHAGHNPFGCHSMRPSAFTSYSTDSLVIATTACPNAEAGQLDSLVRGKGLASASGVKCPSFTPQQVVIGGSARSQSKRARAGDREEESSSASTDMDQAEMEKDFTLKMFGLRILIFFSVVKTAWDSGLPNQNVLSPFHSFLSTQDLCNSALKSWNKVSNISIKSRISDLQKEIACLQDISIVDHESQFRIKCLQSELDLLLYKEEIYWKQRARTQWLKAGDRNTKFFHCFASQRKRNNTIKFLKDDHENIVSAHMDMGNLVVSYFSDLFSSDGSDADAISLILDCLGPPLEELDYAFLDEPFSLKEAVLSCLNEGVDFSVLNTTLISLIPKKQHAHTLKDFRPISLCSTFYKVISKPSRGLRQGDPLSPYLFILCAEGLSALLRAKQDAGLLTGIAISRSAPSLSHLFFADDSLIFCTANRTSCLALQNVFDVYSRASDKVNSVLRSWSSKCFSRAGKEVLLKAVIQAIPPYAMSCFRLRVKLCKGIEAVMARFWWGSSGSSHKIHWKSWKSLCKSKFLGGLGFRSLIHFNQAMLAKQAWRIFKNPSSLLASVLKARYFPRLNFFSDNRPPSPFLSYFITEHGNWDVSKLTSCFSNPLVDDILSVPLLGDLGKDDLVWGHDSSGECTVPVPPSISNPDQAALQLIPPQGAFQMFTDAAIDVQRKKYSVGAIVLNHSNQVVAGLAMPFTGCVDPLVAEAKAIVHALQWASSILLPLDILKTDCKSIVDKLYSCNRGCNILDDLVTCIKSLLSPCPNLQVVHVSRNYNTLAHNVAKWGIGLDSEFVWNGSLPSF